MLPYIPNPLVKKLGASLFVLGILSGLTLGLVHYFSGELVATAETTQPLPQVDLVEQALQAKSQSVLQNTMNKMGVPALRTDNIQTLDVIFEPIHLSPDMGKVRLQLELEVKGITAPTSNIKSVDQTFKRETYSLTEQNSGKIAFSNNTERASPADPYAGNHTSKISYNAPDSNVQVNVLPSKKYITVGITDVPMDGHYVLNAKLEKLKYAYPITSMKLIAKKGTLPLPGIGMIGGIVGLVIAGYFLMYLGTPPELRKTKKPHVRM